MPVKPRKLTAPPPQFSDHLPPAVDPHVVRVPPPRRRRTTTSTPPPPTCGNRVETAAVDLVCTLPEGHRGFCAYVRDPNSPRNIAAQAQRVQARKGKP
jgi:hypothetical protein